MDSYVTSATAWTREHVEARLIATFVAMPGTPVFRQGCRVAHGAAGRGSILTDTLNWAALLDADPDGRCFLWAWARCRATRASFGELCRGMRWSRSTAEDGRRRAAQAVAAALAAEAAPPLDSRNASPGAFHNAEAGVALAE